MTIPKRRELDSIFADEDAARHYLVAHHVFYVQHECQACQGHVSLQGKLIRCTKDGCRKAISLYKHSFFAGSKLKINETLELAYYWVCGCSRTAALMISGHSPNTVTDFYEYFRQLVASSLEESDDLIGGPNIIVEIDESKFGKRKYNRGHRIDGAWVFGGIERTLERKFFVEVVDKRDASTLLDTINRHVLPGSIVHSDCWKAYTHLSDVIDVEHRTVNHSRGFINKTDGTHTNTIEAKWGALKRKISIRGRVQDRLDSHLMEQIWRAKYSKNLWIAFINALRDVHYD
jgi:transposase-like protein